MVEFKSPALLKPCGKFSGHPGPTINSNGVGRELIKISYSTGIVFTGTCAQIKTAAGANLLMAFNKESCGTLAPSDLLPIFLSANAAATTYCGIVCNSSTAAASNTGLIFIGVVN